jgi:hypothetical protein
MLFLINEATRVHLLHPLSKPKTIGSRSHGSAGRIHSPQIQAATGVSTAVGERRASDSDRSWPSCCECSPKHGQPLEQVSACQPAEFRKFCVQSFPSNMNDGSNVQGGRLTITVWKPAAFPEAMFRVLSSKNI